MCRFLYSFLFFRNHLSVVCLLILLGILGCSGSSQPPRESYLRQLLIEDNWMLLRRPNEWIEGQHRKLTEEKLRLMSQDLYAYFRGSVIVYLRDQTMLYGETIPTAFGSPTSGYTSAVIDPHPENIGTYYAIDQTLRIDFNDFDASMYAPFLFDVRRLILGYWIAAQAIGIAEREKAAQDAIASTIAGAYHDEIIRMKAGGAPYKPRRDGTQSTVVEDLWNRAKRDGDANEDLLEYTRIQGDQRVMFYGVVEADSNGILQDRTGPIDTEEERLLREVLRSYPQTLSEPQRFPAGFFTWKAASQRFGAGVSSYPRLRYYLLVEGPSKALEDDILLEVKEIAEPPALPGFLLFPKQTFRNNAERVVWMQKHLQEDNQNDPYLGFVEIAPMVFRFRQRTKYQKNFSVARFREKYSENKWKSKDFLDFATEAGRLLARTHALSLTLQGKKGLLPIANVLENKRDAFVQEQERFINAYGPRTYDDFLLLGKLLDTHGPSLGYQAAPWRF